MKNNFKYIFDKETQSLSSESNIAVIKKLPFLIRNNGLVLTLQYLEPDDKTDLYREVFDFLKNYIVEKYAINENNFWEKIEGLHSYDYMCLQKDMYEFSIKFRTIMQSIYKKKEEKF